MSTIKSSDEHLTLNADGSSKDIKFQANGVEKASIDSSGNLTVSGNLTSVGIDDNADATAMTITSSEKVGIGTTSPQGLLSLQHSNTTAPSGANDPTASAIQIHNTGGVNAVSAITFTGADHSGDGAMASIYAKHTNVTENSESSSLHFLTAHNEADVNALEITSDGRGLSQFTAKAWVNWDGTNTPGIKDSHNVSSVTDNGTGNFTIALTNNMSNTNYSVTSMSTRSGGSADDVIVNSVNGNLRTNGADFHVVRIKGDGAGANAYWDVNTNCAHFFGD